MCGEAKLKEIYIACISKLRYYGVKTFLKMDLPECLKPTRLGPVEGYLDQKNDIIYHPPKSEKPDGCVIFFGGDIQDYKENMMKHRDNRYHVQWDLESTSACLHRHFPNDIILVIRPSKMSLMSFSCYQNFVEVNNFGAPTYSKDVRALKHLQSLLTNLKTRPETDSKKLTHTFEEDVPIKLIAFSKGCVVLNQLLHSFLALNESPEEDLLLLTDRISEMYWLEGGHSGTSETWITNRAVLENFSKMKKSIHIHVTPYQVLCETRPRIGKEEKIFRETLARLGCDVKRSLHFEDEQRCIENHFRVLEVFGKN